MGHDERLRRSQDLLERLFRNSPAAIALVRLADGVVLDVNESYQGLFGWRRGEVIGQSAEALRVWVDAEERSRFRELMAAKGRVVDFESKARRKDGTEFDSLMSAETVEDEGERMALIIVNDVSARRRAEGARALLGAVAETSNDAIIVSDAEMRILSWNSGAERMFGWRAKEAIGRELSLIVPAERWQETHGNTGRMRNGETVPTFETVRIAKDGRSLDVQVSVSGVYEAGQLKLVAGIFRDITERKRAEEALRTSEGRYRTLAATMGEGILILQDGRFAYANRKALELIGYPFGELRGREFVPFIHPEDRALVMERHRRRSAGESLDPRYDIRILPRSGEARWVQIANEKVDWEGGAAVLTVISDITERKRAEAAIRESEQRFRALVELSSDWYWVTDAEHRFTFRDGEILRRMGIPPEDDYGKRRWEMSFPNMSEEDWAAHRALLGRHEEFRDLLLERPSPDGRVHWATISGRPLFDAQGRFAGYHGTGRDVTRQIHAEQRLRGFNVELEKKVVERTEALDAANRELEAFAYSVSHDLRAPLRAIDGFAGLIDAQAGKALDQESRGYLLRVRGAVARMNRMIDDLLAFSYAARAELKKLPLDLSALARSIAGELEIGSPGRRVAWEIGEQIRVYADPGLLRIVLQNLMGNSWKYTGRTPEARIEIGSPGRGCFFVRDNGIGFDPALSSFLFQPFQRLHGAQEFEGTGVGLATVARIVARHGGRVHAEGRPGCGAVFHVELPPGDREPPG